MQPIGQARVGGQRFGVVEPDAVTGFAVQLEPQLEVFFTHKALLQDLHVVKEHRGFKALTPHLSIEQGHRLGVEPLDGQRAVSAQGARQRGGVQPLAGDLLQRAVEGFKLAHLNRATCGHRVATKTLHQTIVALAHEVQRVAQMKARNRATRALQHAICTARKNESGSVQTVFDPPGHDAHHAFMKAGVKKRDGRRQQRCQAVRGGHQRVECGLGHIAHVLLDHAAFAVDGVELRSQLGRACRVVRGQAFNAQGHVGQAPCRVDAGAQCKAKVKTRSPLGVAARCVEERGHTSVHAASADAF